MSKPTARELVDWITNDATEVGWDRILAARVEKVLALHTQVSNSISPGRTPSPYPRPYLRCGECQHKWPCPTVRLLNGEDA